MSSREEQLADFIREYFTHKDGVLYWAKNNKRMKAGMRAGCVQPKGYIKVCIQGRRMFAHRVIFYLEYGYFPKTVDHIDGNPANNHPDNLRPATQQQNTRNKAPREGRKYRGITKRPDNPTKPYRVMLCGRHVGYYETEEKAALAYNAVALAEYGEYARLNQVEVSDG